MICGARRRWLALRRVDGKATTFMPITRVKAASGGVSHASAGKAIVFCHGGVLNSIYWIIEFFGTASMSAKERPLGRPPFRADHVGSLLRPAALRQAFRRHAAREISDAEFGKLQDQCIRDV